MERKSVSESTHMSHRIPTEMAVIEWSLSMDQYSACVCVRGTYLVRFDASKRGGVEWLRLGSSMSQANQMTHQPEEK